MTNNLDESYLAAVEEAIREYRALVEELGAKEKRFMQLRFAILNLSNVLGVVVPPDVLETLPKTRKDVQIAVQRALAKAPPPAERT